MQTEILTPYPSAKLRLYAVWLPMLWGDARWTWEGNIILTDARVIHLWDEHRAVGRWFAEQVEGYPGVAWDAYYLYGPDARWEEVPSPLISSGSTIFGHRQELEAALLPLIRP